MIPPAFATAIAGRAGEGGPDGDSWLASLPALVGDLLDEMSLTPDGAPRHGHCALVVPVRRGKGDPAVLKVSWPHPEAATEHLALRAWKGVGAVRLLAAEPARFALLLERLDADHPLADVDLLEACEVVGTLHRVLDRAPLPQVEGLSAYAERVGERLRQAPLPRRLVDEGIALTRDLPQHPGAEARLLHTDLHDGNVLRTGRDGTVDGWVAIDPKAMNAEAAFGIAPLLWNRWDVAVRAHSLRTHLRLRLEVACDAAGVEEARARAWAIVRELDNAAHAAAAGDTARVTRAVAVVKAMQG